MALHADRLGKGRPRLVLVHGFTQTGRSWAPIAAGLAADHEVVLVDAPGHGASGDVRADLVGGAELLGESGGRGVYIGYSMGARLCLHLALQRPELAEGLVLLGATAGIEDDEERRARKSADDALADNLEYEGVDAFLERWLANPLFSRLATHAAALDDRRRNTVDGLASSLRLAGTGTQRPQWDVLTTLAMPVLVLAGDHDAKFTALGRRLAEAVGPNATFELVADAGHSAHLEQPVSFVAALRSWLAASVR